MMNNAITTQRGPLLLLLQSLLLLLLLLLPVITLVGVNGLSSSSSFTNVISLKTRSTINNADPRAQEDDVLSFLATPGNWPNIVASSVSVESSSNNNNNNNNNEVIDVTKPMKVGQKVDEIFGLPPLIPLSVQWTCTTNKKSTPAAANTRRGGGACDRRLEFFSEKGLNGIASNCQMIFDIIDQDNSNSSNRGGTTTSVNLEVRYQPESILAVLAIPILSIDNALALKVFLPAAMKDQPPELVKFRKLMGALYGVAGIAHFADCVLGPSQLLTMAGSPTFNSLPLLGKIYALIWCAMGPICYALSRSSSSSPGFADAFLVAYGAVEVIGAALISTNYYDTSPSLDSDPLINAILVQLLVAAAYVYTANKKPQELETT